MKENGLKTPVEQDVAKQTTAETTLISRKVFVVHGHDEGAREMVARFLERTGFEPIILHEQANVGRTVIEKVEAHSNVGFAVVLLTPDDEGCEKGGAPRPRARQNVVLELGYFVGRLGRDRVCALKRGDPEIPSDFGGVVYVALDDAGAWKQALCRELEAVGFEIDWSRAMNPVAMVQRSHSVPTIGSAARELLIEATKDRQGVVMSLQTLAGCSVQTNDRDFAEPGNARSEAQGRGAIEELSRMGLLEDRVGKRELFYVTAEGYRIAELLKVG